GIADVIFRNGLSGHRFRSSKHTGFIHANATPFCVHPRSYTPGSFFGLQAGRGGRTDWSTGGVGGRRKPVVGRGSGYQRRVSRSRDAAVDERAERRVLFPFSIHCNAAAWWKQAAVRECRQTEPDPPVPEQPRGG